MIELSPNTALMLYLSMTIAVVLALWCYQHYRGRRQKIITAAEELLICEYCHCAYLGEIGKEVTQCPQCRSFNKMRER